MDNGIDFEQYDSHIQKLSVREFVATIAVRIPSIHWCIWLFLLEYVIFSGY